MLCEGSNRMRGIVDMLRVTLIMTHTQRTSYRLTEWSCCRLFYIPSQSSAWSKSNKQKSRGTHVPSDLLWNTDFGTCVSFSPRKHSACSDIVRTYRFVPQHNFCFACSPNIKIGAETWLQKSIKDKILYTLSWEWAPLNTMGLCYDWMHSGSINN